MVASIAFFIPSVLIGHPAANIPDTHAPFSPSSKDPRSPFSDLMRPESYLSPVSIRPTGSSGDLGEDYGGAPSLDHLDFITDQALDDLIGLNHHDDDQAQTLDEQYVSMRRTVDLEVLSSTGPGPEGNSSASPDTSTSPRLQETRPPQIDNEQAAQTTQASRKLSPYVAMQSCSIRTMGRFSDSKEDIASSSPKPTVKDWSVTVSSPPLQPPQPLPRTRQRNNTTTAALEFVTTDSTNKKAPPTVPPRSSSGAAVSAAADMKRNSPAIPLRPLPKIRMNKPSLTLEDSSSLFTLEPSKSQGSEDNIELPSTSPPPLPPTPRDRMKEGLESLMTTPPRRNSTGPLSSMFKDSFVKNLVGDNSPSFTHRNTPGIGDRSSIEGSDITSPPCPSSPLKLRPPGVPAHYDVPRSWSSGKPMERRDLMDDDWDKASNSLLPLPLNPAPTPPLKPSRRRSSAASLSSSPSSSSLTPSSPGKGDKPAPQDYDEPVVPRRVRLFSASPLTSPNKGHSSVTATISEGLLAVNPQYEDVDSRQMTSILTSSQDDSPELGNNKYTVSPSQETSSSFSGSSSMSHYTVLSAVSTNPDRSGAGSNRANTLLYQPIQIQSVDKPHDYQSIIEFTGRNPITNQAASRDMGKGGSLERVRYQPIIKDTRIKEEDYTMLDSMSKPKGKSPIVLPVKSAGVASKTSEATPTSKSKRPAPPPPLSPENVKVDIDKGRKGMKLKVMLADEEFSECDPDILTFALSHENYDVEHAKHYIRVQHLLGMLLPNITEDDCTRALLHCQQKVDRAALWLMEKSMQIEQGAQ